MDRDFVNEAQQGHFAMKLESVISLEDLQYQINHFNDDKRRQVLASTIPVSVLPLIAVILRFWSRKLKRTPWKQDDYCIVVALVCRQRIRSPPVAALGQWLIDARSSPSG